MMTDLNLETYKNRSKSITIPKDLVEAIQGLLTYDEINRFKDEGPQSYHYGTGRWIRNNWGLWEEGSMLHKWFNNIGIYHPDDMSGIILETIHRILTGRSINLKEQIKSYQDYWNTESDVNVYSDL